MQRAAKPLKYEKDVGTGIYRSYDYSKPSYVLATGDALKLFGSPTVARTNDAWVHFLYLARRKHDFPASGDWFLDIEFLSDRVVNSNMSTAGSRSDSGTGQAGNARPATTVPPPQKAK
jgi:hypothetical protein